MSMAPREVQDPLPSGRACPDWEVLVWPCMWSTLGGGSQPIDRAEDGVGAGEQACPAHTPPSHRLGEAAEEPGQPLGEPAKSPGDVTGFSGGFPA